jgi:hypothetical protein
LGDWWPIIDVCARTKAGEELYARLEDKVDALLPPLTYTPWITINGTHSRAAELHLTRAVCDAYTVRNALHFMFNYWRIQLVLNDLIRENFDYFREQKNQRPVMM